MSEEHTPGPWKVGYGGQAGDGYATIVSPHRSRPIAEMTAGGIISDEENNANAALIASAPRLLERVEKLEKAVNWYKEKAEAFAKWKDRKQPDHILEAIYTELFLDGGRRGRAALQKEE